MRIAVLGLGSAGSRHARLLRELGHEVIGFDPVAPASKGVARADSMESAIESAEAVIVASPNSLHAEQAVAALERGKPVLVEKPLAVSVTDAQSVLEAAERAGVVCGVAMNLRFHPGVLELKRLVDEGALGRVLFARAWFGYDLRLWHPGGDYRRSYSARADLGGGIVLDAIHELDYLLWLLGPVESLSAETAHVSDLELDVEDLAVATLRFESGAIGTVDLNFFEPVYRRGCLLVGAGSTAFWNWSEATVTIGSESEKDRVTEVGCDLRDTYQAELKDFLEAVDHGVPPRTSASGGLAAVLVAETIKEAALAGRRIDVGRD
jgi:predicted dehydrogenase